MNTPIKSVANRTDDAIDRYDGVKKNLSYVKMSISVDMAAIRICTTHRLDINSVTSL